MSPLRSSIFQLLVLILAYSAASCTAAEQAIKSVITGYGYASSSNTLSTGAQGSEHSATFSDPGDCAANVNAYPIGTLIYVVGLQKYFSVQDVCGACSSESSPHFDLWMGLPSYNNATQLTICADAITVNGATASVIVNPNPDYAVDATPLMSGTGACDTDADYSRTEPSGGGGSGSGSKSKSDGIPPTTTTTTTLAMVVSSASAGSESSSKDRASGYGHCAWKGHCRGASCGSDDDCADPLSCVDGVCS